MGPVIASAAMEETDATARLERYWRRNLRLTGSLLAVWFLVTFGVPFFARDLDFTLFGWPFPFWMAAQGAVLVYVAIVWIYARRMERIDEEHGFEERDP